jgi:DNA invertase Pin-like site-specific DNA recombinase
MMKTAIAYFRVSTQRQGALGLGISAQQAAVATFCREQGHTIIGEFVEVESGKNCERPVLRDALAQAKRQKAVLLIARLDRLARNVHFISGLMESDVEFRACDLPEANRLLLHVMAAVGEAEAKAISDRTIAALAAAKQRGTALGGTNPNSRNLDAAARAKGKQRLQKKAVDAYAHLMPIINSMRAEKKPMQAIADRLNEMGHRTRTGAQWSNVQILRILRRANVNEAT